MIISQWTKNIRGVKLQRNYSICLNVLLSIFLMATLLILIRMTNNHTTVLVPVGLSQESVIGSKRVNDSYLIQWTDFVAGLKFNTTPETVLYNQQAILQYISNSVYGKFKAELTKEKERIIADELSTIFYPKETKVLDKENFKTRTTGQLNVYIGETLHESKKITYDLTFDYVNNRLLLRSIKEVVHA